jgi:hypothetical protein
MVSSELRALEHPLIKSYMLKSINNKDKIQVELQKELNLKDFILDPPAKL